MGQGRFIRSCTGLEVFGEQLGQWTQQGGQRQGPEDLHGGLGVGVVGGLETQLLQA